MGTNARTYKTAMAHEWFYGGRNKKQKENPGVQKKSLRTGSNWGWFLRWKREETAQGGWGGEPTAKNGQKIQKLNRWGKIDEGPGQ